MISTVIQPAISIGASDVLLRQKGPALTSGHSCSLVVPASHPREKTLRSLFSVQKPLHLSCVGLGNFVGSPVRRERGDLGTCRAYEAERPEVEGAGDPSEAAKKVKIGIYFATWWALNVVFNIYNKKVLNAYPYPWLTSTLSLACGSLMMLISWATRIAEPPKTDLEFWKTLFPVAVAHTIGHVAATVSMSKVAVSFTHIIKSGEPAFSVLVSRFLLGETFPVPVYLSLLPIIGGCALAAVTELNFNMIGFMGAMISNLAFVFRNIFSKKGESLLYLLRLDLTFSEETKGRSNRLRRRSTQLSVAMAPPPPQSHRSPSPSQPSGKSEVSDLKSQLRQLAGSRAPGADDSKRDLFKKVISNMTIGIDVSSLFGEMVMCSATSDIVLKKMCYLYVGNYAKVNPDLALLTINFLQRDCKDEDPMIRGLALRSLCSLRVANLVEYLVGPLGSGLKDNNSYVRMVAVIGVLKLYHISASTCIDADFLATLKHLMLNDPDTQVVANCLSALQEIWTLESSTSEEAARERETLLSKPVVYHLLNRIKEFSEWAQCLVLEFVSKYIPADSSEIFDMMNLLEDRLQHANGAVVLATVKLFLQLTLSMADVHQQVYERIKAPLLTQVSSGSPEQSYAVLSHLHLLVLRAPYIFSSDYKHFYCQYNEPSYVKKLKLEMLTAVANESNTYEIVTELCEYAANVDIPIARESIRAVGKIALQQYDVNAIVDRLLQFLEMEKDYVTSEALVLVKDLLRKYPQWSQDCIAVVGNISSKNVQEPKAKAALIWMLGEYSQDMHDAPYVLESLVENWDEEHSAEVRLHLLTAVMKCFFKRPPETKKALGAALAAGLADLHQDVHDRALFYYRLLQYNVSVAESVVNPPKQAVSVFADTQSSEIKDRIFDEFNSLSVVYQKPSYMFTDKEHRGTFEFADELGNLSITAESGESVVPAQRVEANDKDLLLSTSEKDEGREPGSNGSAYNAPSYNGSSAPSTTSQPLADLAFPSTGISGQASASSLAIDDLLGLDFAVGTAATPSPPPPPPLNLNPKAVLDPGTFQQKWRQLPISISEEYSLSPQGIASLTTPNALLRHMQSHSIHCIASGGQSPNFKFFFFAQKAEAASIYLVECIINTSSAKSQIKVKADDQSSSQAFSTLFQSALSKFGLP